MNKNYQQFVAQEIREQYYIEQPGDLETLRALDKKVTRPATAFAYTFGTVGALVLGVGMCLSLEVIGNAMISGIVIGCAGIAMVSCTYALYKNILAKRRAKYKNKITELSDKILLGEEK